MDIEAISDSPVGDVVAITGMDARTGAHFDHFAFVPSPLPDAVELSTETWNMAAEAMEALGRLHQACVQIPNPRLLIVPALTREALSTSALEGTYAALPDVLEARLPQSHPKSPEVEEVQGYEEMARQAFEWVRDRPITMGMLSDLQGILAKRSRQPSRDPGRVREHQVVIGPQDCTVYEARYIPPPANDQLRAGLDAWQQWVSAEHPIPVVVAAALAHYQFEALHPFADGNGRVGRLTILLQFMRAGALPEPALTLSPWLQRRRNAYVDHLFRTSCTGDWNPWVGFFCTGVKEQCEAHVAVIDRLLSWIADLRGRLQSRNWSGTVIRLAEDLVDWPLITMGFAAERYGVSFPTAKNAVDRLVEIGVLSELTGRPYGRVFGAHDIMQAVESL